MEQTIDSIRLGFGTALANILTAVPKAIMFIVILVAGYFLAKLVARLFDKVLERLGFDKWVERGGVKKALAKTRYDASDIVSKLLFYAIFLFVLQLAFGIFGPNPVSELLTRVIAFLPSIVVAILIVIIASAIAKGVKDMVGAALGGLPYGKILANVASIAILMIGIFAALNQVGIAPAIVNGLFYAMLAVVAGSAIIAIGGGGIQPMRAEWEKFIGRIHEEAPKLRGEMEKAPERAKETVEGWKDRAVTSAPPRAVGGHN